MYESRIYCFTNFKCRVKVVGESRKEGIGLDSQSSNSHFDLVYFPQKDHSLNSKLERMFPNFSRFSGFLEKKHDIVPLEEKVLGNFNRHNSGT